MIGAAWRVARVNPFGSRVICIDEKDNLSGELSQTCRPAVKKGLDASSRVSGGT